MTETIKRDCEEELHEKLFPEALEGEDHHADDPEWVREMLEQALQSTFGG